MSEVEKWVREYELVFSGPTERIILDSKDQQDPLDISFKITYDPVKNTQGTMALEIYGLSESKVAKLLTTGIKVWLSVGYRDRKMELLFTGDIRAAHVESSSGQHVTKLRCMTSRSDVKPLMISFPEGTTWFDRVSEILDEMRNILPDLKVDTAHRDLEEILEGESSGPAIEDRTLLSDTATGGLTINDAAMTALTDILKTFNIKPVTVNDSLYLVRVGGKFSKGPKDVGVIQAALGENLLTPPRRILENMQVPTNTAISSEKYAMLMLLEPSARPNSIVSADYVRNELGTVEEFPTIIKATEVKHTGQYRSGTWYTEIVGAKSVDFLSRSPIKDVASEIEEPYVDPTYN